MQISPFLLTPAATAATRAKKQAAPALPPAKVLPQATAGAARGAAAAVQGLPAPASQPGLTNWSPARPSAENTATTGLVQVSDTTTTTTGALKVSLLSGGTYTFSLNSFGSLFPNGKKPSYRLTLENAAGQVVKTSTASTLTLSRTDSSRLASGDYTFRVTVVPAKGATASLSQYQLTATQNLSQLPSSSGNADINAVLAGGSYWWHAVGAVATVTNTAVTDTVKQISGARSTLRYQFLSGSEAYLSPADRNGFVGMDAGQKQAVVTAMNYLSSLINVTFVEDGNSPDIVLGTNRQASSAGYSHYPLGNGGNPTVLMLDNEANGQAANTATELQDRNTYAWHTLVHELGHSMGLKHPGNYNAGGGGTPGPFLSSAMDNRRNTVMSYRDAPNSLSVPVTANGYGYSYRATPITPVGYMTLDMAALQYLYGANQQTTAAPIVVDDSYRTFQTVWAPQGVALSAEATTRSNVFDLRPGGYSSIAVLSPENLVEAYRVEFRRQGMPDAVAQNNATALVNSKALKGKIFDGRNTLGLAFGSRYTNVSGGSGNDAFYAGLYSTEVRGGTGEDTLYLPGTVRDWQSTAGADGVKTFTHSTGAVITARSVENTMYYRPGAAAV